MSIQSWFTWLDMIGTLAFAISGAIAGYQKKLDLFGIITAAYATACGGGIIRDACIGALPPAGLSDWRYLALVVVATSMVIGGAKLVKKLSQPVLLFDAAGLSFFAVLGAHKTLGHGHGIETAILLGVISAVGGGALRDLLLNRTPVILQKEIYASAALLAAAFFTIGQTLGWPLGWMSGAAIGSCFVLRYLSLRYHWNLPRFTKDGA